MTRVRPILFWLAFIHLIGTADPGWSCAAEWWRAYTPVVSSPHSLEDLKNSNAGAARGMAGFAGWYGYWHIDDQRRFRHGERMWREAGQLGVKRLMYYDSGEVGDYAGFFAADNRMLYNGWSLPWWKDEPVTARWFGLAAFMADVPWAPWPTAKKYGLPPFTLPNGDPATDLYAVLSRRNLDGQWKFDCSSNPKVTDDQARQSGLAGLSQRQTAKAEVAGKSGWQTVRLVDCDFASPQLRDYRCRELAWAIEQFAPDGVHIDNHGDANILYPQTTAFGLWAMHAFRGWLAAHFSPRQLADMGIADLKTFDIRRYILEKPFDPQRRPAVLVRDPRWTEDLIWNCYLICQTEASLDFHRAVYRSGKEAARRKGLDCPIVGNTLPVFPNGGLMRGACDIAHFEWRTVGNIGPMRGTGLPPDGRAAYVTRPGAAISAAGYCWPSIYVPQHLSGPGHENLHKVLAFDCLANRGLLDFGHAYLDGYSPGTAQSAGFVNRFIRQQAGTFAGRRYAADVGLVWCPWSQVAATTVLMPINDMSFNDYAGWSTWLEHSRRQWDVVLSQDLVASRLSRYAVVVLPSVLVLDDRQTAELARYVASGGRVVATGRTGSRRGPEEFLRPRPESALKQIGNSPRVRMVAEQPGNSYWDANQRSTAAAHMQALLDFSDLRPAATYDGPPTVGVHANQADGPDGPVFTVDLNNYHVDPATDAITPAPASRLTVRLPEPLRGRELAVSFTEPAETGITASWRACAAWETGAASGTVILPIPQFTYYLIVRIASARK